MVNQTTQQLIERLSQLEQKEIIEEGDIILLGLRKINGLYIVDELTNDKTYPVTIMSVNQKERRYDISMKQYYMGRIRFLSLMNNGRLKKRSNKC